MNRFLLAVCMFFVGGVYAASVENIHIRGQVGRARIDTLRHEIVVRVNYFGQKGIYPLSRAKVELFKVGDSLTSTLPDTLDLRDWTNFKIGDVDWKIKGGYQLPGSHFGKWHSEQVPGFITFGHVDCDDMVGVSQYEYIWDNGNPAYSASGSKNWPTKKFKLADGSYAAELTTRKVVGVIASGNLFTGRVVRNMSLKQLLGFTDKDGKDLINWGVPFESRPKGIRVKFKYDGLGDSCTVMATLENRGNGVRRFVGVAWYSATNDHDSSREGVMRISAPDKNGLRTLETAFIYGRSHKNADPLPNGAVQGGADEPITHVNVVFASSRKGDFFKGVKGARLLVKDFEFIY